MWRRPCLRPAKSTGLGKSTTGIVYISRIYRIPTTHPAQFFSHFHSNFIIGFIFPYMTKYLGPYSFGPFAVVLLGVFVFAWTALPETQGTTPEQLVAEMTRTLSQTIVYEPNRDSANQLDQEWRKAMDQLQHEEDMERKQGTYDYGFKPIDD